MDKIKLHPKDNVEVLLQGENAGHKVAILDIKKGQSIIKYGNPIGYAIEDIKAGDLVHTHNIKTHLEGKLEYSYNPVILPQAQVKEFEFMGYKRPDGRVGIRNDIWIIPTVGCVNKAASKIASRFDNVIAFEHPYGCSQMGDDQENTQKILSALVKHPNAGGVLVLGLGCENNNIEVFKKVLGTWDENHVKFLNLQDVSDEEKESDKIINKLTENANKYKLTKCSSKDLIIGLKCGGSDGFSGITGNPLVGRISDMIIKAGGSSVLTEVPEMFGAEHLLMNRAINKEVFEKIVYMINDFKDYYIKNNQPVYENPSPGNKKGGITTLEDKSLGCTQKSGDCPVVDVLNYGDQVISRGLNLLSGPGNDIVAVTNLAAAGCQLILFTTGRGTPLGSPAPVIKIATNNDLYTKKPNWCDFDASLIFKNGMDKTADLLMESIIKTIEGEPTKNEINEYYDIAIFKNGVTL